MHLTAGPTVYHNHHYHHHHLSPQTNGGDWNFSGLIGKAASVGGNCTTSSSTLDPTALSGNSSPPGSTTTTTSTSTSTSASSQPDLWWTERLISEAQQEFPGELGLFCEIIFFLFKKC